MDAREQRWFSRTHAERSQMIGTALRNVRHCEDGLEFVGLSDLFGLARCRLRSTYSEIAMLWQWKSELGLRILGLSAQSNGHFDTQDEALCDGVKALSAKLKLLISDEPMLPFDKHNRATVLALMLQENADGK